MLSIFLRAFCLSPQNQPPMRGFREVCLMTTGHSWMALSAEPNFVLEKISCTYIVTRRFEHFVHNNGLVRVVTDSSLPLLRFAKICRKCRQVLCSVVHYSAHCMSAHLSLRRQAIGAPISPMYMVYRLSLTVVVLWEDNDFWIISMGGAGAACLAW